MQVYLRRKGTYISCATVHKYMNTEMQLFSVSRRKKPGYVHGAAHKVYDNKLKQNFHAKKRNRKWCTDFTYLTLADGRKRYNCTIIDLYDRSVIAGITDRNITSDLAKRTLEGNPFTVRNRFKTADTSFGSGKPVHIQGVHRILYRERNHPEHEQSRISI